MLPLHVQQQVSDYRRHARAMGCQAHAHPGRTPPHAGRRPCRRRRASACTDANKRRRKPEVALAWNSPDVSVKVTDDLAKYAAMRISPGGFLEAIMRSSSIGDMDLARSRAADYRSVDHARRSTRTRWRCCVAAT